MRQKLILWLILLLSGFLIGFIPQFLSARRTQSELEMVERDLASSRLSNRLAGLRDSATRIYLETSRRNYGTASENSNRFFDQVRELAGQSEEPGLKAALEQVLAMRDGITAGLAGPDPSVLNDVQALLIKTHETIRQ